MREDRDPLERFVAAQDAIFPQVVDELTCGEKRSHWMWFVFPQIAGLGASPTARHYALAGLDDARLYLAHPILGPRLAECTRIMLDWAGRRSAVAILGSIDALKFSSSMTLFERAAGDRQDDGACFGQALDTFNEGRRDERTLALLVRAPGYPAD